MDSRRGSGQDSFIPDDHPIRRIKPIVDSALQQLSPLFDTMYSTSGRPSIPPEHLLKASLLIALYSIRSERQFCELLRYDLLFKWFLDLNISDEPFDASSFSKSAEPARVGHLHGLPAHPSGRRPQAGGKEAAKLPRRRGRAARVPPRRPRRRRRRPHAGSREEHRRR